MMFGRAPKPDSFPSELSFDPSAYQAQLRAKLAALQDFVEAHVVERQLLRKHHMIVTVLLHFPLT